MTRRQKGQKHLIPNSMRHQHDEDADELWRYKLGSIWVKMGSFSFFEKNEIGYIVNV